MDTLADRMQTAADKIGAEALRLKTGLSPDTFYRLKRGEPPKTVRVLNAVKAALREVGVPIPRDAA